MLSINYQTIPERYFESNSPSGSKNERNMRFKFESTTEVSIHRFLWLIGGMSLIDLVWTLLAHQANQIAEVNPVGNVLLGDAQRTIMFKVLATILAIGILYKARHSLFARKACWWVCLTLALLMARWVLVSGVST